MTIFQPYTLYSHAIYKGYIYTTSVTKHAVKYIPICSADSLLAAPAHNFAIMSTFAANLTPVSGRLTMLGLRHPLTLTDLQTHFPELFI